MTKAEIENRLHEIDDRLQALEWFAHVSAVNEDYSHMAVYDAEVNKLKAERTKLSEQLKSN